MALGIFFLLIASFIGAALSPIFVKLGVREIPPITFTALRFLIAAAIFLPIFLRQKDLRLQKKDILILTSQSLFFFFNVLLFSFAIQYTTVIMSQILYACVPIFVGFLAYVILKERLSKNKIIGGGVALLGISLLLFQSLSTQETITFGSPWGNLLGLGAVISWSIYMVLSKKLTHTYSPVTTSFFSFLTSAILLFLLVPMELFFHPLVLSNITSVGIISLLGAGIISSAIMFFLIQVGIKRTTALTASLFQYTAPFFAAVTAIPILGEQPTPFLIVGGMLILGGVFYATTYTDLRKKGVSVHTSE
jgi:drug/metabolite transporter (DMT)-like permease